MKIKRNLRTRCFLPKKLLVTGSLAFDFIMDFPGKFSDHIIPSKIHAINLSFLVSRINRQRGGTAGNIGYNLALLGVKPIILATAGNDFSDYRKFLESVGVDTSMVYIIKKGLTGRAFIFTDMVDNQITGFYPGAMKYAKELSLKNKEIFSKFTMVIIAPNEPEAMINFAKECQELGMDYLFDPGMQLPRLTDQDLRLGIEGAKIVIGNDYEIALIKKRLGKIPMYITYNDRVLQHTSKSKVLITTLGEKGSIIESKGGKYEIPPAKPKAVLDPTGAGDAYRAGVLAGYLRGFPLGVCGKMGSVCAVYTVEKYGTTTHKFSIKQFCRRYKENFKDETIQL